MVNFLDLQTMIILIEGEYNSQDRNTPGKMVSLIKKEFNESIDENDILNFYNISFEDYEQINRNIEYDFKYKRHS